MKPTPVIAIFDIGKTNKKFFLFNEQYKIVLERTVQFEEMIDEDGFACDNLQQLSEWVHQTIKEIKDTEEFDVKAFNFSAYGASFVHIGEDGKPVAPLYNYLNPYPPELKEKFYNTYGGEMKVSVRTASPVLGNLNSGMQLYYLKNKKKDLFDKIKYSLHLPQYISYLVTGKTFSDITSIGSHTVLWDFTKNNYHDWVQAENIQAKLAPIFPSNAVIDAIINNREVKAGIGLHDSSAALIPYLASFSEPFVLLSTGTWCISLNPFNDSPLTEDELKNDCLFYINYTGHPVKASRIFAGNEHEQQIKRLADHFNKSWDYYTTVGYNAEILSSVKRDSSINDQGGMQVILHSSAFTERDLSLFKNYEEAYHQLIFDIIVQQAGSTQLVLKETDVRRIFVDGGFSKNVVYMFMLASVFPQIEVFAASVAQASAIGAALAIHQHWNSKNLPLDIVELKKYCFTQPILYESGFIDSLLADQ